MIYLWELFKLGSLPNVSQSILNYCFEMIFIFQVHDVYCGSERQKQHRVVASSMKLRSCNVRT